MLIPETRFIIGNWKTNPDTLKESSLLAKKISGSSDNVSVVVCPPDIFIENVKNHIGNGIAIGAQGFSSEGSSALTGGISLSQLISLSVQYCIVGHSSQRAQGETNADVNLKIRECLAHNIIPIVCIGEKERDENSTYLKILESQITATFSDLSRAEFEHMIIAYEPLWAIGSDSKRSATPAEFETISLFIKKIVYDMTGQNPVGQITIVYGGAIDTIEEAVAYNDIGAHGLLIGRASLDVRMFNKIISVFS